MMHFVFFVLLHLSIKLIINVRFKRYKMLSTAPCHDEVESASLNAKKTQTYFQQWIEESNDMLLKEKTSRILNYQKAQGMYIIN